MPAKPISIVGDSRSYGDLSDLAKEREELKPEVMAEMLYQGFEQEIDRLTEEEGVVLPPPTDMNGQVWKDYDRTMHKVASVGRRPHIGRNEREPISSSERAIVSLMEVREDMLKKYAAVSHDVVMASTLAMSIQKMEDEIISMGGDVERFDPAKMQSGLKPIIHQVVDQKVAAEKVIDNTKQAYTLKPISQFYSGKHKTGKLGLCIKIAVADGKAVRGTIVPKEAFTGQEVIDYVPDSGKGRMTVKTAGNGYWEDISSNFDIAWIVEHD